MSRFSTLCRTGFLLASAFLIPVSTLHSAVVAKWSFEDNLKDTAAAGTVPDDLTAIGTAAYAPGIVGRAGNITAGGMQRARAENSDDLHLGSHWTLEAFVLPDANNRGEWDRFWTMWGDGGNEWHFTFRSTGALVVDNGLDLFINGNHNIINSNNTASVPLGEWSHVAVVGNETANTITMWLNGVEVGSAPWESIFPTGGAMNFGNFESPANGLQYSGLIDEAMIHDTAADGAYLLGRAALRLPVDPDGDRDGDGLTNREEQELGTDPDKADTDGDGLKDGSETLTGVWNGPADTGTDPRLADSDGDGLPDGVEDPSKPFLNAGQPGTDPNLPDTDADGFQDGVEIGAGTNPKDAASHPESVVVAKWSFEDNLEDSSTGGVKADILTETGTAEYAPGIVGQAGNFTASGMQRARAANSPDLHLGTEWTLEAFVRPDADNTGEWDRFWTLWSDGGSEWHLSFRTTGAMLVENGIDFFINGNNNIINSNDTASVPLEEWSYIALVGSEKEGTITAWLNGAQVGSTPWQPIPATGGAMNFGNFESPGSGLQYSGLIDEAMIHQGAVPKAYLEGRAALLGAMPTPPSFEILGITHGAGSTTATVTWTSTAGRTYAVDWSGDLKVWFELEDGISGFADHTTFQDNTVPATSERRFYRVRELAR